MCVLMKSSVGCKWPNCLHCFSFVFSFLCEIYIFFPGIRNFYAKIYGILNRATVVVDYSIETSTFCIHSIRG